MAKVKLNPVLEQINGQVGDLVFKRYQDEVILARKASPGNHEPTAAQQATRDRFRNGAHYGKMVMADPTLKAEYAAVAKAKKKPIFSLMVTDYLYAPTVTAVSLEHYTGAVGETVYVAAFDDFGVTEVAVSLSDQDTMLESGVAAAINGRWAYTTTTTVTRALP
ncbi:MAG: hypothetical protein M5U34_10865 [Chloroflexi bacterium]|nr:hypothetical protein [Chloroflexota bacterium]